MCRSSAPRPRDGRCIPRLRDVICNKRWKRMSVACIHASRMSAGAARSFSFKERELTMTCRSHGCCDFHTAWGSTQMLKILHVGTTLSRHYITKLPSPPPLPQGRHGPPSPLSRAYRGSLTSFPNASLIFRCGCFPQQAPGICTALLCSLLRLAQRMRSAEACTAPFSYVGTSSPRYIRTWPR